MSFQLKTYCHNRIFESSGDFGSLFAIAGSVGNLGFFENGSVKVNGLFCVAVEPQKRNDFLHIFGVSCGFEYEGGPDFFSFFEDCLVGLFVL